MKTKVNIFFLVLLFSITFSCDDFLDVDNKSSISEDENVTTESWVNAVYATFMEWDMTFSWIGVSSITSDNADKGSDPGDTGTDKQLLDNFDYTSTSASIKATWQVCYKVIGRANDALYYIDQDNTLSDNVKHRMIGEVKFLRGLIYFRLAKMFGGVPIIDHVPDLGNPDDMNALTTRATLEEVYDQIESDLTDAIAYLPLRSEYSGTDVGRATKGAAQAILAKAHLYQKEWQEAYDLTTEVINSGQYDLLNDFAEVWRAVGENSEESLFEIQARGESPAKGIQQYSQVQAPRGGSNGFGWGFNTPTQDLLNAFNAEGDSLRKNATIIFRGETLFDGYYIDGGVANPMYNEKAYSSLNHGAGQGDKNVRIMRYAEVLLINAEAANELNMPSQALTSLNKVRSRVFLPAVTVTDKTQLRELIWKERRLELAMEHDRFFDLIRQGRAGEVMRAHGKNFVDGKHELFPIPQTAIDESFGNLTQNPGYIITGN